MKIKVKTGDLVYIEWIDHFNNNEVGWKSSDKLKESAVFCETVGFVVKVGKHYIYTSPTMGADKNDTDYCGGHSGRLIRDITKFKVLKKKGKKWNLSV